MDMPSSSYPGADVLLGFFEVGLGDEADICIMDGAGRSALIFLIRMACRVELKRTNLTTFYEVQHKHRRAPDEV